jgi:hypothetical protein
MIRLNRVYWRTIGVICDAPDTAIRDSSGDKSTGELWKS